jgi:hypothetical protein
MYLQRVCGAFIVSDKIELGFHKLTNAPVLPIGSFTTTGCEVLSSDRVHTTDPSLSSTLTSIFDKLLTDARAGGIQPLGVNFLENGINLSMASSCVTFTHLSFTAVGSPRQPLCFSLSF